MNKITLNSIQIGNLGLLSLMIMLGGLTGLVYIMLTPVWWIIFLGAGLLVAVFINNRYGFIIILANLFIFNWLFGVVRVIPREITWLPDIIIIAMTTKLLFLQATKRKFQRTPIDIVFLSILAIGLLSAIYNNVSIFTVLFGFRNFFKYVLLFYIVRNIEHDEKFYRGFLVALFILAIIQIPITIAQAFVYGTVGEDVADNIVGTLGGKATGAMAVLMGFAISMMVGFFTQYKKTIFIFLSLAFAIPMILGSGQFGLFISPIAAMLVWILSKPKSSKTFLKIPIMIGFIVLVSWAAILYHDYRYQGNMLKFLKDPSKVYNLNMQTQKEGVFGRFEVIVVSNDLLMKDPITFLFGYGMGNASESYFAKYSGKIDQQFRQKKIGGIQLTSTILEFGYLGLILFLMMFYLLLRMSLRIVKLHADPFWRAIAVGYSGVLLSYILGIFYKAVWFYDVLAFPFWLISAALVVQLDFIENQNNQNSTA